MASVVINKREFARAAGVIAAATVASKLLGFVRESVIAARFGASGLTDAYVVAQTVPNLVWLVVGTALSTTVVPAYTAEYVRDPRRATQLYSSLMILVSGGTLLLAALMWGLTAPMIRLIAPGFPEARMALAVQLTRVLLPMMFFLSVGAILTGVEQAHRRFTLPALAPVWQNLVVIGSVLLLSGRLGIEAAALGLLVGTLAQTLAQLPGMRGLGRFRWRVDLRQPALADVGRLMTPVLLGMVVVQLSPVINRMLGSNLPAGSISALNYANLLFMLPTGLFTAAVSTVLYPALSDRVARDDQAGALHLTRRGLDLGLLIGLPVALLMMVLGVPMVRFLFEHGAFDARATGMTALALAMYAAGLPAATTQDVLRRTFYARQDTRTPMAVNIGGVAVTIALSFALVGPMGLGGLALAATVATWVQSAWLALGLKGLRQALEGEAGKWGKILLASLAMAASEYAWQQVAGVPGPGTGILRQALWLGVATALSAAVYGAALWLLRVPEVGEVLAAGRRLVARRLAAS
ncbi:MAG: murein biosynthesis integral membrane protein MurJ [Bacillota bacterium]|nr:murein biosynthesis integral membrane protein MurJ [Bacillota bacterium]